MTENPQDSDDRIRQTDVSRLPFTAGIVLGISPLVTFVLGLYTISSRQGWLFLGLGIFIAATAVLLVLRVLGVVGRRRSGVGVVDGLGRMGGPLPLVQYCGHRA